MRPFARRAPARGLAAMGVAALVLLSLGCASAPIRGGAGDEPWQLPASELGQQSLFRVSYRGPAGSGSLKLVLRLRGETAYRLAAADLFGRPLWTLVVNGDRGLWIDDRAARWCALGDAVRLPDLGVPELPLRGVPALLLGRAPLPPGARDAALGSDYRDADGRRWTLTRRGGELTGWTYWEAGKPALWFSSQGGEMVLSARQREAQLRWRRTLREPLSVEPPALEPPAGYAEGGCDEPRLP